MAELSDAELDCVAKLAGTGDLLEFLAYLGPKDATQMYDCLNDETMMRMFLGAFLQAKALSEESSACIRPGVAGIDLRSAMQVERDIDDEQALSAGVVQIVAYACLNDEDWQAVASARGLDPSVRELFQCMMDVLGGPEGTAAKLGSEDDAALTYFLAASTGCGLELGLVD